MAAKTKDQSKSFQEAARKIAKDENIPFDDALRKLVRPERKKDVKPEPPKVRKS